jgi:Zn-dependent protease with chaperone function
MRKVIITLLFMFASSAAFAVKPADIDEAATLIVQKTDEAVWKVAQEHAVPSSNPTVQRVTAVFARLAKANALEDVQVLVTDTGGRDVPAAAFGSHHVIIQVRYARMLSDDALAVVIGHETGHLRMHHVESRLQTYLTTAISGAGIHDSVVNIALASASLAIEAREQEEQADAYGVELATHAGFDGKAGLKDAIGGTPADMTHPSGEARLAAIQ